MRARSSSQVGPVPIAEVRLPDVKLKALPRAGGDDFIVALFAKIE